MFLSSSLRLTKRHAFWSLNEDILKITVLTTNTPYPSRKIRRICACTHQRPQDPIRRIKEDQYAVFKLYGNKIFWKISNVVPTPRNPQYAVSNTLDTPEKVDSSCDYDCEDEVASVDNDMAKFMAKKDGYGTQSLLEQWTKSYENGDYGYDPYDDDMYEG
ncbi:hypothetical protein Tco_0734393 [Tanacetum coccineum]